MRIRIVFISVFLFGVSATCFGALRGYSTQTNASRRSQSASFVHSQERIAQVADGKNNFMSAQQRPEAVDDINAQNNAVNNVANPILETENNQSTTVPTIPDTSEELFTDDAELSEIISSLDEIISALNSEIDTLDMEIIRCKQEKKTNTIITTVGAVGTLGTGIGAIIQGKKLHDKKKSGATEKEEPGAESE